jgi:AcrR family transcriptional regulator
MPASQGARPTAVTPLLDKAATRSMTARYQAAADDVARIVEATYCVMQVAGTVDPPIRNILDQAGCSSSTFYRHFGSKDELLLAIIDDGRRRMAEYLNHRMAKAPTAIGQVREWIEGVVAQAVDSDASARTRPFFASTARLDDMFPEEQAASQQVLLAPLNEAIVAAVQAGDAVTTDIERDTQATFDLTFAFVQRFVLAREKPSTKDIEALVSYCERALGAR